MRLFPNMVRIVVPTAALHAVATCSGCADNGADFRASAATAPPLGTAAQGSTASTWTVVTSADFNLDGLTDVLWFDTANDLIKVWLMNGTRPLAIGPAIAAPPGDHWEPLNAVDFSFDGMADVVWYNSKKNVVTIWLMKGTGVLADGPVIAGPGDGWDPCTRGEFNGRGMADLFWYNAGKNAVTVWLMNGTRVLSAAAIP